MSEERKRAIENIQLAKALIYRDRRYISRLITTFIPVPSDQVGTMAVDKHLRLYYSNEFVSNLTVKEVMVILYHEALHIMRQHLDRGKGKSPILWNIACDMEINDDIAKEGLSLPDGAVLPGKFDLPNDLLAEEYYERLLNNKSVKAMIKKLEKGAARPMAGRCGSVAHGSKETWELDVNCDNESYKGYSDVEVNAIRRATAKDIKDAGHAPGHLSELVNEILEPKIDWRTMLRQYVSKAVIIESGKSDYSFLRRNRRSIAYEPFIVPGMVQYKVRIGIILDVSGSMEGEPIRDAIAEIYGIVRNSGGKVLLIEYDTDVQLVKEIDLNFIRNFKVQGYGGTKMDKAVEFAKSLKNKPDIFVLITDGYTNWPDSWDGRFVVCIVGDNKVDLPVPCVYIPTKS